MDLAREIGELSRGMNLVLSQITAINEKLADITGQNASIVEEVKQLRLEKEADRRRISMLENHIKRKNLVFRGIPKEASWSGAVGKICADKLGVAAQVRSARKIYERGDKMSVIAEFESEEMVERLIRKTGSLAGTTMSIERDLNSERLQDKKVLIQLKNEIVAMDKSYPVKVRDDKMKIGDKWIKWNAEKELICGPQKGMEIFNQLYGARLRQLNIDYTVILNKVNNK